MHGKECNFNTLTIERDGKAKQKMGAHGLLCENNDGRVLSTQDVISDYWALGAAGWLEDAGIDTKWSFDKAKDLILTVRHTRGKEAMSKATSECLRNASSWKWFQLDGFRRHHVA